MEIVSDRTRMGEGSQKGRLAGCACVVSIKKVSSMDVCKSICSGSCQFGVAVSCVGSRTAPIYLSHPSSSKARLQSDLT